MSHELIERVGRCMEKVSDHQECADCSGVMMVNYNTLRLI